MKANPIKQFLDEVAAILESLTKLMEPGEVTRNSCSAWALNYLNSDNIHARLTIMWDASIDFNNCAEWWLPRLLCRLAHGDECGSAEYVNLKRNAKKAYADILKRFQESDFQKETYSVFEMNREKIRLYFNFTVDVHEPLFSPQLLEMKKGIISKILKSANGAKRTYDTEKTPMFFGTYQELLAGELGIKDVKVFYTT